jgi:hypothetical protein
MKTTINIPDQKWQDFQIKVIKEYGVRKVNQVIETLIDKFLAEEIKVRKK